MKGSLALAATVAILARAVMRVVMAVWLLRLAGLSTGATIAWFAALCALDCIIAASAGVIRQGDADARL